MERPVGQKRKISISSVSALDVMILGDHSSSCRCRRTSIRSGSWFREADKSNVTQCPYVVLNLIIFRPPDSEAFNDNEYLVMSENDLQVNLTSIYSLQKCAAQIPNFICDVNYLLVHRKKDKVKDIIQSPIFSGASRRSQTPCDS